MKLNRVCSNATTHYWYYIVLEHQEKLLHGLSVSRVNLESGGLIKTQSQSDQNLKLSADES